MKKAAASTGILVLVGLFIASTAMAHPWGEESENAPYNAENRTQLDEAIQAGDYDTWKSILEEYRPGMAERMTEFITPENFYLLKELRDAREAGDLDKVREIADEIGFPAPRTFGMGHHPGGCPAIHPNPDNEASSSPGFMPMHRGGFL